MLLPSLAPCEIESVARVADRYLVVQPRRREANERTTDADRAGRVQLPKLEDARVGSDRISGDVPLGEGGARLVVLDQLCERFELR